MHASKSVVAWATSTSPYGAQMDPRDELTAVSRLMRCAQCDKQATVIGRLLTTPATVDVP